MIYVYITLYLVATYIAKKQFELDIVKNYVKHSPTDAEKVKAIYKRYLDGEISLEVMNETMKKITNCSNPDFSNISEFSAYGVSILWPLGIIAGIFASIGKITGSITSKISYSVLECQLSKDCTVAKNVKKNLEKM